MKKEIIIKNEKEVSRIDLKNSEKMKNQAAIKTKTNSQNSLSRPHEDLDKRISIFSSIWVYNRRPI